MNKEILKIAEMLKDAYNGEPWFGKPITKVLIEVNEDLAFEKPNNQHSILELVWHMVNWRQFTINRVQLAKEKDVHYFEETDWQQLDNADKDLWQEGLHALHQTQIELVTWLEQQQDTLLDQRVEERAYTYRKLLNGVIQHDVYHLGQIAYIEKLLKNK